jgi:hypothetical protein
MENDLPEKPVMPPIGTPLQLEVEGYEQRLPSSFVGSMAHEFLIIKTPVSPHIFAVRTNIFKGKTIIVRFITEGIVFGFPTRLIEAINTPEKLIFITYPISVSRHELRSAKRVDCLLPAKIKINGEDLAAVITDISETGCLFFLTPAGSQSIPGDIVGNVTLSFFLPGIEKELIISGLPRNIKREDQKMSIGTQFTETAQEMKDRITWYLNSFMSF